MNDNKKIAREAGWFYLGMGITGMLGIMYVPSQIIVANDAAATAQNIADNQLFYKFGIACQLACQVLFVYLVLALDRLLRPVNPKRASQMVALVITAVPIAFLNMLNQMAGLILLGGADFLTVFTPAQLNAVVLFFFNLYEQGVVIVTIFWGLWLIPFGQLVYHSRFIPKIFGTLLIIGGIGYLITTLASLFWPDQAAIIGTIATIPSAVGEFAMIFYLLIKGVREQQPTELAAT